MTKRNKVAAVVLHLRADNNQSGNPRRLYVLISAADGNVIGVVDEGYLGRGAIPAAWRAQYACVEGPAIAITPSEYRDWKKNPTYTKEGS